MKPNVYNSFINRLQTNDTFQVDYNSHSELDSDIESDSSDEEDDKENENSRLNFKKNMYKKLEVLKEKFERYCSSVPVLGFNSSKYDLNLIKSKLAKILR